MARAKNARSHDEQKPIKCSYVSEWSKSEIEFSLSDFSLVYLVLFQMAFLDFCSDKLLVQWNCYKVTKYLKENLNNIFKSKLKISYWNPIDRPKRLSVGMRNIGPYSRRCAQILKYTVFIMYVLYCSSIILVFITDCVFF